MVSALAISTVQYSGFNSLSLKYLGPKVGLELLRDLADQALERLADQQLRRLLVPGL